MNKFELFKLVDGQHALMLELYEDGTMRGDEVWQRIVSRKKELGLDRLVSLFNNGYILSRVVEE